MCVCRTAPGPWTRRWRWPWRYHADGSAAGSGSVCPARAASSQQQLARPDPGEVPAPRVEQEQSSPCRAPTALKWLATASCNPEPRRPPERRREILAGLPAPDPSPPTLIHLARPFTRENKISRIRRRRADPVYDSVNTRRRLQVAADRRPTDRPSGVGVRRRRRPHCIGALGGSVPPRGRRTPRR